MPILELKFPAGRFHATPWGRHVNEGAIEWPPSPWRVLRALIATWHLKAQDDITPETMHSLVLSLVENAPQYWIPPATSAHTRHYMPYNVGKNQKTTKVFDTFVRITPNDALLVLWNQPLTNHQLQALRILADRLGYCGRAESLVEGRVIDDMNGPRPNVTLMRSQDTISADKELVHLLGPMANEKYLAWRQEQMSIKSALTEGKQRNRGSRKPTELPEDIPAALLARTDQLQAEGWPLPPGASTLQYLRPARSLEAPPIQKRKLPARPLTVARFEVASQVMPQIVHAISVADRMHKALLARFPNGAPQVFSGRDETGKPLKGNRHAFIFCEPCRTRDIISHITVYVPRGPDGKAMFDDSARHALRATQKLWGHGGHDLQLVLIGLGEPRDFPDSRLFAESTAWQSLTPFVPTRHAKYYRDGRPKCDQQGWHIGSAAHVLRRLIAEAGLPAAIKIEPLKTAHINDRSIRWLQFRTHRPQSSAKHPQQPPCGFRLVFPERVKGPLAFGYGAHFGLGLFVPADSERRET